ncbi:MAG: hypothetical protein ACOCRX_09785 [Candidatus Woesearchaeota archaeon]
MKNKTVLDLFQVIEYYFDNEWWYNFKENHGKEKPKEVVGYSIGIGKHSFTLKELSETVDIYEEYLIRLIKEKNGLINSLSTTIKEGELKVNDIVFNTKKEAENFLIKLKSKVPRYQCPKCLSSSSVTDWNEETKKEFKAAVLLKNDLYEENYIFKCPSCEEIIFKNKIKKI